MSASETFMPWMPPPDFDYGFPPADPEPVDGCPTCAGFVEQRRKAEDKTAATDANVLMGRHLERDHR